MGDDSAVLYGTPGTSRPRSPMTAAAHAALGPVHGRADARGAVHELPWLPEHLRVHTAAADEVPLYERYDSLYRFLHRATAPNPDDRFQTADEMADQLFGILREVVAIRNRSPRARGQQDLHQRIERRL